MLPVHIIVAATRHGEIGYKNTIPWKLEGDLKRFSQLTRDQIVIVGLNTFESMPPLKGRAVIIVSKTMQQSFVDSHESRMWMLKNNVLDICTELQYALESANAHKTHSGHTDQVAEIAKKAERIYIAGGARLYEEAWNMADFLELTLVVERQGVGEYDTRIENFSSRGWELIQAAQPVYAKEERRLSHIYYTAKAARDAARASNGKVTSLEQLFYSLDQTKHLELLEKLTKHTPADGRDYFNAWTSGDPSNSLITQADIEEGKRRQQERIKNILDTAGDDLNTGKVTDFQRFVTKLTMDLHEAMGGVIAEASNEEGREKLTKDFEEAAGIVTVKRPTEVGDVGDFTVVRERVTAHAINELIEKFDKKE